MHRQAKQYLARKTASEDDFDKARQAGVETAEEVNKQRGTVRELTGDAVITRAVRTSRSGEKITSPLKPEKFDGLVASIRFEEANPDAFKKKIHKKVHWQRIYHY